VPWAEEATPLAALATSRVGDDRLQAASINRGPRLMTLTPDADLYLRGAATLVASWRAYARGSVGAALMRLDGVSAAVFPSDPERAVYNNALLDRDLGRTERAAAVDAMEAAYDSAGVDRYAAWVHESDEGMRTELSARGYAIDESTRAMGMALADISLALPEVELGPLAWAEYLEYLRIAGAPAGLLRGADPSAFQILAAQLAGETVATAIAFDHDGDCGVFNMSTLEAARRQGLATSLTARHVHDAIERGCLTASLQATAMAERVYAAVGFRDLGRILEYAKVTQGAVDRVPTAAPDRRPATVTEVLLVSGSLRADSVNSTALRTAAALAGDGIRSGRRARLHPRVRRLAAGVLQEPARLDGRWR